MKVAVLGFGTVGQGVYGMLAHSKGLEPGPVLVRPGKDNEPWKVADMNAIVSDASVGAVAEVMGGVEPAFSYCAMALKAGKHVVTSNKALVAARGIELAEIAREHGAAFLFSAACGGGVPFLHNLSLAVLSDRIESLGGILNGTTNYMLDAMQRRSLDYGAALSDAQKLGYAEADPTADVSGLDALRKIMLGCAVGFDALPDEGLDREGIESITAADVADIKKRGLTCRLLARGGRTDGGVYAYVEPVLFTAAAPECSVLDNFNLARYHGEDSGDIVMIGQGAGRWPTASAVLRDLSCVLRGEREMLGAGCVRCAADNEGCVHSYYVRLPEKLVSELPVKSAKNENGVARVITEPVSVASMHAFAAKQRENGAELFFAAVEE